MNRQQHWFRAVTRFVILVFYVQSLNPALLGYAPRYSAPPTPTAAGSFWQGVLDFVVPAAQAAAPTATPASPVSAHRDYVPAYAKVLAADDPLLVATPEFDLADPYLVAKANELGRDPARIFAFVRDAIGFESYVGSLRGARGTLWSMAGNALDQASLLIALLRISGVPARYAQGTLAKDRAQTLIASMFEPAPYRVVGFVPDDAEKSDPVNDPALIAETRPHYWVEFQQGGAFTAADPSFKSAQLGQTFTAASGQFAEVPDTLRHKVTVRLLAETGGNALNPELLRETVLDHSFSSAELVGKPLSIGHFVNSSAQGGMIGANYTHTYSPYLLVGQNDGEIGDDPLIRGVDYQEFVSSVFGSLANSVVTGVFLEMDVIQPGGQKETFERALVDRVGYAARNSSAGVNLDLDLSSGEPALSSTDVFVLNCFAIKPFAYFNSTSSDYQQIESSVQELEDLSNRINFQDKDNPALQDQLLVSEYNNQYINTLRLHAAEITKLYLALFSINVDNNGFGFLVKSYPKKSNFVLLSNVRGKFYLEMIFSSNMMDIPYPGQLMDVNKYHVLSYSLGLISLIDMINKFAGEGLFDTTVSAVSLLDQNVKEKTDFVVVDAQSISKLDSLEILTEAKLRANEVLNKNNNKLILMPAKNTIISNCETISWIEIDALGDGVNVKSARECHKPSIMTAVIGYIPQITIYSISLAFVRDLENLREKFVNYTKRVATLNKHAETEYKKIMDRHDECVRDTAQISDADVAYQAILHCDQEAKDSLQRLSKYIDEALTAAKAESGLFGGVFNISQLVLSVCGRITTALSGVLGYIDTAASLYDVFGGIDPPMPNFLFGISSLSTANFRTGSQAGFNTDVLPEPQFTLSANQFKLASLYRLHIQNTGPATATYRVTFPNQPPGFTLKSSLPEVTIPAGETGVVGIMLIPNNGLPTPGTQVPFEVAITDTATNETQTTPTTIFTTPDVVGITLEGAPTQNTTTPGDTIDATLTVKSIGNVAAANIPLTLETSTGLSVSGLPATVSLGLGETKSFPLTLTAGSDTLNDTLTATITASFGQDLDGNPYKSTATLGVSVRSAETLPIERCAQTAVIAQNSQLAQNLASLAEVTAQLQQQAGDTALCGRATLLYDQLLQLADVNTGLTALKPQIQSLRALAAACDTAPLLTDSATFFTNHCAVQSLSATPAIALAPTSVTLEPGQGTTFALRLENTDTQPATFNLSVNAGSLPTGVSAQLSRAAVTLGAGEVLDANSANPVTLTLSQTLTDTQSFAVQVQAALEGTSVTLTAAALVRVASSQADVVSLSADPVVIDQTHPTTTVTAKVLNTANVSRSVQVQLQVLNQTGTPLQTLAPVPVNLVPSTAAITVNLGSVGITGLDDGIYRLRASLLTTGGQPLPGHAAETLLFVGMPITATVRAEPELAAPGNPTVKTVIDVTSRAQQFQCQNLIDNGSFEQGPGLSSEHYVAVVAGSHEIPGWSVTTRTIDVIGEPGWTASQGSRSIDLDGTPGGAGGLAQTFATTPDKRYVVLFDLASNPAGPPTLKAMQVAAAGQSNDYTFDITGKDTENMGWVERRWEFTAAGSLTTLAFSSLNTPPDADDRMYGAAIDNVRVYDADCTETSGVPVQPEKITVTGTVRDFKRGDLPGGHPDFETGIDWGTTGLVQSQIGPNRKPVLTNPISGNGNIQSAETFAQWFNDTPGVNLSQPLTLTLDRVGTIYTFSSDNFFPIDDALFGNEGLPHNYSFTYELHLRFTYVPGQTFNFVGDDDVWVFINNQLVIDLGGVHPAESASVNLDTLGLTPGQVYPLDFFFTERHTSGSVLRIDTDIAFVQNASVDLQVSHRLPAAGYSVNTASIQPAADTITAAEIDWQSVTSDSAQFELTGQVPNLAPGESRAISTGTDITATYTDQNGKPVSVVLSLPPLFITAANILTLDPPSRTVPAGETATYSVLLSNPTGTDQTYTLGWIGLENLSATLVGSMIAPAGQVVTTPLTVTPATSTSRAFAVTAATATGGVSTAPGELLAVHVTPPPAITLTDKAVAIELIPTGATAGLGDATTFTARVINLGDATTTFSLTGSFPAGFTAQLAQTSVTLLPGRSNYRDVTITLTPPTGTTPGDYPLTVTATAAGAPLITDQAVGTLTVVGLGVKVDLTPAAASLPTTLSLKVTNTGRVQTTYQLALAGPAANYTRLPASAITLAAGAARTLTLNVGAITTALPGDLSLTAIATAQSNGQVRDSDTTLLGISAKRGLVVAFNPDSQTLAAPGPAKFLLRVQNTGNQEEAYQALISSATGPVSAALDGLDGQATQRIETFRLPALATGLLTLDTTLQRPGTGQVTVTVKTLDAPALTGSDTASVRAMSASQNEPQPIPTLSDLALWLLWLLMCAMVLYAMRRWAVMRR